MGLEKVLGSTRPSCAMGFDPLQHHLEVAQPTSYKEFVNGIFQVINSNGGICLQPLLFLGHDAEKEGRESRA